MLTVDGTEGGGQLLRTALSLSTITGTPFRIEDVRGARPNPGLKPQHLAAVRVVADCCDAAVEGAELGADALTFRPGDERRTTLDADIGTAGSVTLLFDAVLPIAVTGDEPLELTATGGTDVKWAPTMAYHRLVKLPLLTDCGVEAAVDLQRTGFYPAGGGEATLRVAPSPLSPVALDRRGELERVGIYSKAAASLADREVADRQAESAREELAAAGLPADIRRVEYVEADSPGSSLLLRGVYEEGLVGVDALGERGRPSEAVAEDAVREFGAVHATDAAVDPFMADQLLVVLALAGGRVRIPSLTDHVRTNLDLLAQFGSDIESDRRADGTLVVAASALR
ncbi:RNA 3'-terminal phosphate cyclase [Haloplanus rubicundus]|uniref:RNA 3'-terminal phosphate cyclase n=1 Tax=Haloplanus rubicundus TaxID=1547898 RepID=A0A345DYT5_9EURY|nr:RNA 3'-terminal phosphate cyclase [Haloplanus rubicundus]AXG05107.1 RNA 3'-terminal phosphate cyclase [Haloplanus rubicundus]AXG11579.1 RNA 3'-terminal phosphate cyclase [Haloplanus rubicundus]